MEKYYKMSIAGLSRDLPMCKVNDKLDIAAFIMFGDVEMTVACAGALLKKVPEFDVILVPEAKGIPLAYEMARQSGKKYFVARKVPKVYMTSLVTVEFRSITTRAQQRLYLDGTDCDGMRKKRVLIVDDVISTGETLEALEKMLSQIGSTPVGKAAVLAEGDAAKRGDITFLEYLPLFFN